MIFILDNSENVVGVLSNEAPEACPYFDDHYKPALGTAYSTYEFSVPLDHPSGTQFLLKENGYIVRSDRQGNLLQFQIADIDDDNGFDKIRTVHCEIVSVELNGNIIRPQKLEGVSGRQALEVALDGTRWEAGNVDWLGIATFDINEYKTSLAFIHEIAETFGAELIFRVEIDHNKVTRRIVDFVKENTRKIGKRFDIDKNIERIKRTRSRRDAVSALIGLGKGDENGNRLTFKNVEWRGPELGGPHPVTKPLGQDWVGDPEALQYWGIKIGNSRRHLEGIYESETQDAGVLLWETWNELQRRKNGVFSYELDAVLLAKEIDVDPSDIMIGDTVEISDTNTNPPILAEARVIEMDISFSDPTQDKVTLGNYKPAATNINKILKKLQSKVIQNETAWSSGEKITKGPTPPENPTDGQLWLDTSKNDAPVDVLKRWDETLGGWVKATATQAQEIGAETPQGAQNKANQAEQNAKNYAEPKVSIGATPPANPQVGHKWVDTSVAGLEVWKRWDGTTWKEIGRINLSQMFGQIVENQISIGAVSEQKLADLAVTLNKLAANSVDNTKIVDRTITANEIAAGAITSNEIAANTIQAGNIAAKVITAEQIASRTITANEIAARTITANEIAAGTITANEIAARSITGDRLAANTITANELNVTQLSAITADLGNVTSGELIGVTFKTSETAYLEGIELTGTQLRSNSVNMGSYLTIDEGKVRIDNVNDYYSELNADSLTFGRTTSNALISYYEPPDGSLGELTIQSPDYITINADYITMNVGLIRTSCMETGFCGVGGVTTGITGPVAGVGVNFRTKKTYTPSSISLSGTSHNLIYSTHLHAIDISPDGFWLYIDGGDTNNAYRYWRGYYTA